MDYDSFCGKTRFSVLCKLYEDIASVTTRDKKANILKKFMEIYREQSRQYENDTFYPILRLLLPQLEHERGPYGIKELTLANMYIRILCLAKGSKDAQKLLSYRANKVSGVGLGDLAEVVYFILRSRCSNNDNCSMTVYEVNRCLDNISQMHSSHDPRGIDNELRVMIIKMSPLEQKWLIRILLKDLKLSLPQNRILSVFHEDAEDLYDVCNDLKKIALTLKDPAIRLNEIEVSLFEPFRPMLSQRCDVQRIDKELPKLDYYIVETKYDGERFQLHYKFGEFKYFSRNGYDYTDTYGCNVANGILTPHLASLINPSVTSCILDGEMMCWNTRLKSFTTKGGNIDVKLLRVGNVHQACFCVFDILLHNDNVLTNKPLTERINILDSILEPREGILMNTVRNKAINGNQIMKLLNDSIDNLEEGIIIKDPNSVYKPNSRKSGWYKIKPEYTEGLMVELDVLIIGGYYGKGGRRGLISQFLVALAIPSKKPDYENSRIFHSLGRVGSGCKKEELEELHKKLCDYWKSGKSKIPVGVEWAKEKPDLCIEPKNSCILQLKATEVTRSDAFKVGYTLRFPRIQKVRFDKPWTDCLTVEEFHNIRQATQGKLRSGHATEKSDVSPSKKFKKTKQPLMLNDECNPTNFGNVKRLYDFFNNLEICVLTNHSGMSKLEIEKKIVECGGTVSQNPGEGTYCVLATDGNNIRVRNVLKLKRFKVIKIDWILKCFNENTLLEFNSDDFIVSSTQSNNSGIKDDPLKNEVTSQESNKNETKDQASLLVPGEQKSMNLGTGCFKNNKFKNDDVSKIEIGELTTDSSDNEEVDVGGRRVQINDSLDSDDSIWSRNTLVDSSSSSGEEEQNVPSEDTEKVDNLELENVEHSRFENDEVTGAGINRENSVAEETKELKRSNTEEIIIIDNKQSKSNEYSAEQCSFLNNFFCQDATQNQQQSVNQDLDVFMELQSDKNNTEKAHKLSSQTSTQDVLKNVFSWLD